MTAKEKAKGKFEAALEKLESVVARLEEEENLDLEQAIELYAQGTKEAETCAKELAAAEAKIKKLTADAKGNLSESEFEPEAGEDGK